MSVFGLFVLHVWNDDDERVFRLLKEKKRGKINQEVKGRLTESLNGVRVIKAFTAEEQESAVFSEGVEKIFQNVKKSLTATASSAGTITLSNSLAFDFSGTVGVRYYRFWPYLKRPAAEVNNNMITNERGFLFSLDVNLIPDYYLYFDRLKPTEGDPEGEYNDNELTFACGPPTPGALLPGDGAFPTLAKGCGVIASPAFSGSWPPLWR